MGTVLAILGILVCVALIAWALLARPSDASASSCALERRPRDRG